jgi:hypothetical protein
MLVSHPMLLSKSPLMCWQHLLWLLLLLTPPLAGACLTTCTYNDAKSSAQRVLQYLESLKDAEANQEDNRSSFTTSCYLFFY